MAHFSLSWDGYKNNICSGLSALQQNGEFVDMTLAADGHHVKVHQLVLSLASSYIKEIITSTQCQHPVIFLNKISYTTLCSILEYIYTGEVVINNDALPDLIEAGKDLCIKGLEELKYELKVDCISKAKHTDTKKPKQALLTKGDNEKDLSEQYVTLDSTDLNETQETNVENEQDDDDWENSDDKIEIMETVVGYGEKKAITDSENEAIGDSEEKSITKSNMPPIQYSLSNLGGLQLIMNRYIYNLRYTSKKGEAGHRLWKCASYQRDIRCSATVITQGGAVIRRTQAHNHPFHDKAILRKVRNNAIFSTVDEKLEEFVEKKKSKRSSTRIRNE